MPSIISENHGEKNMKRHQRSLDVIKNEENQGNPPQKPRFTTKNQGKPPENYEHPPKKNHGKPPPTTKTMDNHQNQAETMKT